MRGEAPTMTMRLLLVTAAAGTTLAALGPAPASADPVCAQAQASGLFLVEHVGPLCVDTPLATTTQTATVTVGTEQVTVTYSAP